MSFKKRAQGKSRDRNKKGDRPVLSLRGPHGLKASTWENEHESNRGKGEVFIAYSTLPARSYYDDKTEEYVDTPYLREDDLLPMAQLLQDTWTAIQRTKDDSYEDNAKPESSGKLPPSAAVADVGDDAALPY